MRREGPGGKSVQWQDHPVPLPTEVQHLLADKLAFTVQ
jgi:hypothetical protein